MILKTNKTYYKRKTKKGGTNIDKFGEKFTLMNPFRKVK